MNAEAPAWQYDETRHTGADFADPRYAESYDDRMARLRDVTAANEAILGRLDLAGHHVVIDFGAGTGDFALAASEVCREVYAVDIAPAMLAVARRKAEAKGIGNIRFVEAGFLTYAHEGEPADAAVSQKALHHLPDYWKLIALRRVADALRPGGKLLLGDVVFSFDPADCRRFLYEAVADFERRTTPQWGRDFERHVRQEYSTLDWVMEGLLRQAGFAILSATYRRGILADYLCEKRAE